MVDILEAEYDNAPYQSYSFSHTHPTHLYTLAKLFGLNPTPVEKARVLELGCASGGNIIPMAYHFPTAEFVGIDLASKQVDMGLKVIKDLNIKNIQLKHQSISDFKPADGKFDYIICHGVYSWVNQEVQDHILKICKENLNPQGIAYVSYNTYPGWNMVNSVRDMMYWHTKNIQDPPQKASQARALLKFITDGLQDDKSPYALFLKGEIELLSRQADSYLLHDHLSSFNSPVYFYQFMEAANKHQLSYLSDTFLATMYTENLPQQFSKELNKINNIIIIGQYMDFIRNQRFRCTLLCHNTDQVNRALKTQDIESYYLQFLGKPSDPNFSENMIKDGVEASFTHGAITLKVRNKISLLAMLILWESRFKPIHYNDLCQKVHAKCEEKDIAVIKQHLNDDLNLLRAAFAGLINITSYPVTYTLEVNAKPLACPLARYQAEHQNYVTNRRHEPVALDPVTKALLPHVNGKNTLDVFEKKLFAMLETGKLTAFDKDKKPITDKEALKKQINLFCTNSLENMARNALLIYG
ncbi:MAG: methyltransferase regulatory domain-containing protein [Proteobacteria bacterium]|nr:methyltransferase regulatory domain-containing protein [Pseudomonadota bacterium]